MKTKRDHADEKKVMLGNATRSHQEFRYDLIPAEAIRALAKRYYIGEMKHGEANFMKGNEAFVKSLFNHAQIHFSELFDNTRGESIEENAAAIMWGMSTIIWYNKYRPEILQKSINELRTGFDCKEEKK